MQQYFKLFLVRLSFRFHSLTIFLDTRMEEMMRLSGAAACVPEMTELNQASVWPSLCHSSVRCLCAPSARPGTGDTLCMFMGRAG